MHRTRNIALFGFIGVLLILGALIYFVFRTPATASGPIQAIPLAENAPATATSEPAQPTPEAPTTEPTLAASPTVVATVAATEQPNEPAEPVVMQIVPGESEVRFLINEVLNNAPFTVVGVTDQVAGELAIDPNDPAQSRIGVIQINARTLSTDNDFRNRAIKNRILNTDQYEYITFTPVEITGLPEQGALGEEYSFQVAGDLLIRDVAQRVIFDVTATAISETRIEGTATATIRYADFGLSIPQVPQVASVDEDVRLEIDFVAVP